MLELHKLIMYQCYYCEQLFDSKEELYNHVEVHSDVERNREIMSQKKNKKNIKPRLKKIE